MYYRQPIRDIEQRIFAGELVPSGECPDEDCGALCQIVNEQK